MAAPGSVVSWALSDLNLILHVPTLVSHSLINKIISPDASSCKRATTSYALWVFCGGVVLLLCLVCSAVAAAVLLFLLF